MLIDGDRGLPLLTPPAPPPPASPPPPKPPEPTQLLDADKVTKNLGRGTRLLLGFEQVVSQPKVIGTVLLSVAAVVGVIDKLQAGKLGGGGSRLQAGGNILLPLAGAIFQATGHPELATAANDAQDANSAVTKGTQVVSMFNQANQKLQDFFKKGGAAAEGTAADGAAAAVAKDASGLSKMAKLGAGIDVARGVISGFQAGQQVIEAFHDPSKLEDPNFDVSLAYNALGAANGAMAAVKLTGAGDLVSRLNPFTGIAFDAVGIASDAMAIKKDGLTLATGIDIASNSLDLAGNVAMMALPPVGVALKGAALGLQVVELGVKHAKEIEQLAGVVVKDVGNVANGAVQEGDTLAKSAFRAVTSVFSGW